MDKLLAIVLREYMARVRSKWFILSTLFAPLFLVVVIALPALLLVQQSGRELRLSVIDRTGEVLPVLLENTDFLERYSYEPAPSPDPDASLAELREEIREGNLSGYVEIPRDALERGRVEFWGRDIYNPIVVNRLQNTISDAVQRVRARKLGLEPETVEDLSRRVELATYRVTEEGARAERASTREAAQGIGLIIYIVVLAYGAMMLRAAVAEKTTKMVEIILSSVRPWQLMLGKILGVGAVGLTQVAVWLGFGSLALVYAGRSRALNGIEALTRAALGADTVLLFLGLFLTGYFLYAGMYAAVGAIASSEQEAAQLQLPVTLVAIVPPIILLPVLGQPDSGLSIVLSWFPLFAPVLFLGRYVMDVTAVWEVPLVLFLQLAGIALIGYLAGRIYRIGLLMTGVRPTLPELLRWIRHG